MPPPPPGPGPQPPPTPLIACVGKPSAGKSSLLNSLVGQAVAKAGNYPFTTIDPNHGVGYVRYPCPCARFGVTENCKPRYGACEGGERLIPVRISDVAGLVPGASKGAGLGNKFLDDLRTADVLVHVVDVSGTTDAGGKETVGYDPIDDIDWLKSEIHAWVLGNLEAKWSGTLRRHLAIRSTSAEALLTQFSGYGADLATVQRCLARVHSEAAARDKPALSENFQLEHLETWTPEDLSFVVECFLRERFPTVIALNKIDLATPDTDRNIDRICRRYGQDEIVLTSALAEFFLRKLAKQNFIRYREGADTYETSETAPELGLVPLDDKTRHRLNNVQDLVLFRYGGTGVGKILSLAVQRLGMAPVYVVGNINSFAAPGGTVSQGVFRDVVLVPTGTTVKQLAQIVLRKGEEEVEKVLEYAMTPSAGRVGHDEVVNDGSGRTPDASIYSFKLKGF
ncbi:P-loop containing nucleoside triphosphate hydrolase protein [Hyaloraphidium curvatum]|nr:P-loop containing nucleoside triphosphate hydrolase protein [Hyaloraphidium curvatum]